MLPAIICELPNSILSSYLPGRGDELQQIDRVFSASSDNLPAGRVVHGMPGVGKTQLALQYAKLACGRSQDMYTFWLSSPWAVRFGSGHEVNHGASVARRSYICEEVASHSGQCDPRDYRDDPWPDPSSTK